MSKAIEELSKNLASGMSRRRALWRFAAGLGAVGGLGLLAQKKASANILFKPQSCIDAIRLSSLCIRIWLRRATQRLLRFSGVWRNGAKGVDIAGKFGAVDQSLMYLIRSNSIARSNFA